VGGVSVRKVASPRRDLAEGFTAKFIYRKHSFPFRFAKNYFGSGCFLRSMGGVRCLREPRCGRRPMGFQVLAMSDFDRRGLFLA